MIVTPSKQALRSQKPQSFWHTCPLPRPLTLWPPSILLAKQLVLELMGSPHQFGQILCQSLGQQGLPLGCPSSLLCVGNPEVTACLSSNWPGHHKLLQGQVTFSHGPHPAANPAAMRKMRRHWTQWIFWGTRCSLWWTGAAVSISPRSSLRALHWSFFSTLRGSVPCDNTA